MMPTGWGGISLTEYKILASGKLIDNKKFPFLNDHSHYKTFKDKPGRI